MIQECETVKDLIDFLQGEIFNGTINEDDEWSVDGDTLFVHAPTEDKE